MADISVSIVLHNTPEGQLRKALKCLLGEDIKVIYLIDNGEAGNYDHLLTDRKIKYFKVPNRGFGAGHNVALRELLQQDLSSEGLHLVMNADVYWEGKILSKLAEYMQAHPDVGLIMPKVYYPDGDLQYACRLLPSPLDVIGKRFLPEKLMRERMERYLLAIHDHEVELNCPYLLGSFLFFRIKALKECGVFDERFFLYPEDIDISRRIHEKWKTMYWPGVSIVHEHAAESRHNRKMLSIHVKNMIKYFNKWGWFFDSKRREYNRRVLDQIKYIPFSHRPKGRG